MKKTSFLLFIYFVIGTSCNKNEAYIKVLEKFVYDVERNYKEYSSEDWLKKDKEFMVLSNTRFIEIKDKLSPEERSHANQLIGRYNALKIKKDIGDLKNGIIDMFEQGKAAVKELLPDSAQIKDAIEKGESKLKDLLPDTSNN